MQKCRNVQRNPKTCKEIQKCRNKVRKKCRNTKKMQISGKNVKRNKQKRQAKN